MLRTPGSLPSWASCPWVCSGTFVPKEWLEGAMGVGAASWDCRGAPVEGCRPGEKDPKKTMNLNQAEMLLLLSQGFVPGLTHVGVVETSRHEAPLCPVPPRTRGVTTIAPGGEAPAPAPASPFWDRQGDGASLGGFKGRFGHIKPLLSVFFSSPGSAWRHQGLSRALMAPNPKVPPYHVPDQLLLPGATGLGDSTPQPVLSNWESHRQKACA